MTKSPTVTIITPCYNGGKYVRATIESALKQTCPPLEVLVIDDGSTDDSAAIAESFGPPVRVMWQPNQGESVARNRGLEEARGEYVLFLDADDLLQPEALQKLTEAIQSAPDAVAIMNCAYFRDDPAQPYETRRVSVSSFFPSIIEKNLMPPHCSLTPTALLRQVGGFCTTNRYFEDWDMWLQVALTGAKLIPIDFVGALYRRHAQSQTQTAKARDQRVGQALVIRRFLEKFLEQPELCRQYAQPAFWATWTALHRAREAGVSWGELRSLSRLLPQVARCGPDDFRRARFPRLVRLLGARWAESLRAMCVHDQPVPSASPWTAVKNGISASL